MPRTAILSDIHANLPALAAVLADVDAAGVDEIFFGGDTVGYGANPAECVALVRERGGKSVLGNHDFYTLKLLENPSSIPAETLETNPVWAGVAHAAETLDEDGIAWLQSLPLSLPVGKEILAHAALHEPERWPYLHSPGDAAPTLRILREQNASVGFFGHTHQQTLFASAAAPARPRELGDGRVSIPADAICAVVVGSVGQPRGNDDLRAGWALWDSDERIMEFHRTAYPAVEAALAIFHAGLPIHSALRLLDRSGLKEFRRQAR